MQGFNRYIPPDYDPKQHSTLNSHAGKKHALGKRAKDIDKGILIVRFELPFNIWCGTCGNHIGAGVRYNAQKRKVGNYYSTPIFAFRCKCHLCSGWFELRTDPQNSRYIVEEGAKQKDEDWNPEEHGGYAARDSEAPSAADPPADPIAALEKTIDQQQWAKANTSRLTELSDHSARISADPYAVSLNLRRRFREEKKMMLEKQKRDDGLRERYGIHEDVDLGEEDVGLGREMWEAGREKRGLPVEPVAEEDEVEEASVRAVPSSASVGSATPRSTNWGGKGKAAGGVGGGSPSLAQVLRKTTARRYDPFDAELDGLVVRRGRGAIKPKLAKVKDPERMDPAPPPLVKQAAAVGLLSGYESD